MYRLIVANSNEPEGTGHFIKATSRVIAERVADYETKRTGIQHTIGEQDDGEGDDLVQAGRVSLPVGDDGSYIPVTFFEKGTVKQCAGW